MADGDLRGRRRSGDSVPATSRESRDGVLLAEGAESEAETYRRYLEDAGLSVSSVGTGSGALEALRSTNPVLLVLDLNLPDVCGLTILHHTRCRRPPCSTIVTTKNASIS